MLYGISSYREFWNEYKSEVFFLLVLSVCVAFGHRLSCYIPLSALSDWILPLQHGANIALCLVGAGLLFRHSDGLRIRRASAAALIAWGLAETALLLQDYVFHLPVLRIGSDALNAYLLLVCNFLGWILLVYPTETLRPGWLDWKKGLLQLLPMVALVGLDYLVPADLRWLICLYPAVLLVLVLTHLRAYRIWCEQNYSSMEHIDAQWVLRYLFMLLVVGLSYLYVASSDNPGRVITQNALIFFVFAYSIEQILFRQDPWDNMTSLKENAQPSDSDDILSAPDTPAEVLSEEAAKLKQWMVTDKPYLNPDLKLIDLRAVLPMNRTYLSEFINTNFGCTFYQFVNNYRIEEAKRLMRECPELKMADVAARAGFSSQSTFNKIFTKETGCTPGAWVKRFSFA